MPRVKATPRAARLSAAASLDAILAGLATDRDMKVRRWAERLAEGDAAEVKTEGRQTSRPRSRK